ncbi:MAG: hypothetical protein KA797_07455, partial [Chitinophagales bacterium]|nr:hypothetical protein [Chitinophagales bacterium]
MTNLFRQKPVLDVLDSINTMPECNGIKLGCPFWNEEYGNKKVSISKNIKISDTLFHHYFFNWSGLYRYTIKNLPYVQGPIYVSYFRTDIRPYNNSAIPIGKEMPFFCINKKLKYSFTCKDEDGDSLTYELVSARHNNGGFTLFNTPYLNGTSPTHPTIDCGFHFDQKTGVYKFVPTEKGVYAITVKVSEYRGDSLMAYNIREEQFNVYDTLNCFNASIKNISTTACPIATNHSTTYDSFGCYVDTVKNFDFTFCHQNNIVLDIQVSNPDSAQMTFKDYTGIGTITDLDVDKTQVIRN